MAKSKSKYAGVGGARPQMAAIYPNAGHYLIRVDTAEEGQNFKKEDFIAVRYTVLKVFGDSVLGIDYDRSTEDNMVEIPPNSVGQSVSDLMKISNIAFAGRIKAFTMVATDCTEAQFEQEEYDGQIIDELVSEEQPAAGVVLELRVEQVVKQNARDRAAGDLKNENVYTKNNYIRRLSFAETLEMLGDDVARKFIPDIDEEIAAEVDAEAAEA